MSSCRTRRSTSPTETFPSTSARRSSRATTSRPRSRRPFDGMSRSRRAGARATTRSSSGSGPGKGRKVRFTGVLLGEWTTSSNGRYETFRVYRGRTGKYVLHVERSADYSMVNAEGKPAGWRGYLGVGDVSYGNIPGESTLEVVASARGAPRQDPAAALRQCRCVRQAAGRGRPRHLTLARSSPTAGEAWRDDHRAADRDPGRGVAQVVRPAARPRWHRPRGRRGHGLRPPRAERRREDDHGPDPVDPDLRRRRRGPHRRPRHRPGGRRGPGGHRGHGPVLGRRRRCSAARRTCS